MIAASRRVSSTCCSSATTALVGLSLALSSACTPSLVWRGVSDDRAHVAEVHLVDGGEALVVDGETLGVFETVDVLGLRWRGGVPVTRARLRSSDRARERLVGLARGRDVAARALVTRDFVALGEHLVEGEHVSYEAAERDGWHVGHDDALGPPVPSLLAGTLVSGETIAAAIGRDGAARRVVTSEGLGRLFDDAHDLRLGGEDLLAYAGTEGQGEARRDQLVVDGVVVLEADEVLEVAVATDAPRWAALLARGDDVVLVRGARGEAIEELFRAPTLTHLRIGADGAHVACLVPAPGGGGIAVVRDGDVIAQRRRVEGDSLALVPGTDRVVVLAEEAQGIEVLGVTPPGERFEEVTELALGRGGAAFVARRGAVYEVWMEERRVGVYAWAGSLSVGSERGALVFAARAEDGARYVVTRRGRWPVPRLYVDTLVADARGRHWAALHADAVNERLEVFVDGVPFTEIDPEELGSAMAALGERRFPSELARRIVRGELARAIAPGGSP